MVYGRGFDSRRLHQIPENEPASVAGFFVCSPSQVAGVEPAFFVSGPCGPQSFAAGKLQLALLRND